MGRCLDVSDQSMIAAMHFESERSIQRHGGRVGFIDVQHSNPHALLADVVESRNGESPAQSEAMEVGVDGDDVDLTEDRSGLEVDLGPTKRCQSALAFVEQKAFGVEPGLALSSVERLERPASLFVVPGEGAVVHLEPGQLIGSLDERPCRNRGSIVLVDREIDAHLQQGSVEPEACSGSFAEEAFVEMSSGIGDPPVQFTAAVVGDHPTRGIDETLDDLFSNRALDVVGQGDGECLVSRPTELRVGGEVPPGPSQERLEAIGALLEFETELVGKGVLARSSSIDFDEFLDDASVAVGQCACDLHLDHVGEAIGHPGAARVPRLGGGA